MSDAQSQWWDNASIPGLLRQARQAYANAMREALAEIGCSDVPGNGMFVIGTLASHCGEAFFAPVIAALGVSKQAATQVVDTLVERGYLMRADDPADRRKLILTLTPRGHAAAAAQRAARDRIDAKLTETVGPETVRALRHALATLCLMTIDAAQVDTET